MTSQTPFRVLLIEDNPGDALLVVETLTEGGGAAFQLFCAEALLPGLERLARGDIDLVLLDLSLPDSHGLDGLSAIRTHAPTLPVVLLTGSDNQSLALKAMQIGAQDYLVKGTLQGPALARILQHAIVRQRTQKAASPIDDRQGQAMVVGLLGAKGGVGTTTIACHLGKELRRQSGGRVLLMDLGEASNAIAFLMNATGSYTIVDATKDILRLDQALWAKLVVSAADGLDVIQSAGLMSEEEQRPSAERVRLVIRLVRMLYSFVVIDMGRLSPFSARIAEEVTRLHLVSTCDVLGLNETKGAAQALCQLGFDRDQLSLVLNRTPKSLGFTSRELEKLLGLRMEIMLPESHGDFSNAAMDGKRLGESRTFLKQITQFAAGITGIKTDTQTPKPLFSFLPGPLRRATTTT